MSGERRIAIVHDWLDTWRGGEHVLAEIVDLYPQAELFSLVDFLPDSMRAHLHGKHARTSFLQRIPGARAHFRSLLPLFTRAIESFDVSPYPLVISSSHAVAKGVRTGPAQLHICYCHTPMRYAWDQREHYLGNGALSRGVRGAMAKHVLDRLQVWDRETSRRVNLFIANSAFVRDRIARSYGREAHVINPPVDIAFFTPAAETHARTHYLTASRFVPYKRIDLIVDAFRQMPERRLTVIGEGPEARRIRALAGSNVELVGEVPRERLRDLLRDARAFVFAAEEDFGILPVEAQACGTPVIAYGAGGALETVRGAPGERATGVFFRQQSRDAIVDAIRTFEALPHPIDPNHCRANAELFSVQRFREDFERLVESAWRDFARVLR